MYKENTIVRTTQDNKSLDWSKGANRNKCQWDKAGTIIKHSDSHGLCYLVKHQDGSEVWYEAGELFIL